MPLVPFESLPDDSRVWVFAADRAITGDGAGRLLATVDTFLDRWAAHGEPLRSGRDWREDHFLTIAVDQSTAGASGCSIDGLYRSLQRLEPELGASLVGGGGRVYLRDAQDGVRLTTRAAVREKARAGGVGPETRAFDLTVHTLGAWRQGFEAPMGETWMRALVSGAPSGSEAAPGA